MGKKSLLFVFIAPHFKEMIRAARVLKNSIEYEPIIFFVAQYTGVEKDIQQCESENIACYVEGRGWAQKGAERVEAANTYNEVPTLKSKIINCIWKVVNKFQAASLRLVHGGVKCIAKLGTPLWNIDRKKVPALVKNPLLWISKQPHAARYALSLYKFYSKISPHRLPAISRALFHCHTHFQQFLDANDIRLIIFPEHNVFLFTQLYAYLGRQRGIPAIIVPFTIANTLEWSEGFYNDQTRSLQPNINRLFAELFPHWTHTHKHKRLIMPVDLILFYEMLGITPKKPWLLNSGEIDFLAVESDAMKEYYIAAGLEEKHLKVVGALYNDELHAQLQNQQASNDQPILLCALPPNQTHGRESLIDFQSYEEIVRFILAEMAQYADQYSVIINLHPRTPIESVAYISDYPVHISSKNIAELVPSASVYLASCSATIRMAISCGIPVINYDLYKYNYDDYRGSQGVLTMTDKDSFKTKLQALVLDKNYYMDIKDKQINQSHKWGTLDGKAGQMLLKEIDLLFA